MRVKMSEKQKTQIREYLQKKKLLCDGAFGTYYALKFDTKELPELANVKHPERVMQLHAEYLEAGAQIIRTNTFAANTYCLARPWEQVKENICSAIRLAKTAIAAYASEKVSDDLPRPIYIAADIGQIPYENLSEREAVQQEYIDICRTFLKEGVSFFVFETFSSLEDIIPAIASIGDKAFIVVQYSVNQFGYSTAGLSARKLVQQTAAETAVDAVGFNCGVGPAHMSRILQGLTKPVGKFLTALPNAGYPQIVTGRMIFSRENREYFVEKVCDIAKEGVDIVGGCCGTTPEYIGSLRQKLSFEQDLRMPEQTAVWNRPKAVDNPAFYAGRTKGKLIAVELAPPAGVDDEKLMDAAHLLQKSGVDVLTFPDSPSGRTRADSILMAEKVARETGMCVMPHICCRDKNAIAMRSQLLGAYINHIRNFLVVTGDPVPSMVRTTVKSVFHFDSVGLMQIISDMNEEQFTQAPVCFGGAINQSRRNLEVEIGRVKKKMAAGATFFLTQPISTRQNAERVRRIKEETNARILCGIMPFVSLKNATFMRNEMAGIDVTEEVLKRYQPDMSREEGEQVGVGLAREIMELTEDFADGYYFSFPFNRVSMLQKILQSDR